MRVTVLPYIHETEQAQKHHHFHPYTALSPTSVARSIKKKSDKCVNSTGIHTHIASDLRLFPTT